MTPVNTRREWRAARRVNTLGAVVSAVLLFGCDPSVPAGVIRVKNDSRDREYNVVQVAGGGKRCTLEPGDSCLLPKGTRSLVLSRRYKEFTRSYSIQCPALTGSGITVKMIDAHLNRLAGGCKTVSASR